MRVRKRSWERNESGGEEERKEVRRKEVKQRS